MPSEALPLLDEYIREHEHDDEAYTLRGMKYWAMGMRANAINDYLSAIRINPDSKARLALLSANAILDYYNKDLLNP
ncbi:MAG: tetratricopeptide repeat protein [Muribaculaceae bacterium]|nr:tetratricopeptide repeat protein [Muribaculaceae bacterium]MDE5712793.1 tetratricopeptide repeat protein [Muribaculaceae bacterium]